MKYIIKAGNMIISTLIGGFLPLLLFLLFLTISQIFKNEKIISILSFSGFFIGLIMNLIFIYKWIKYPYKINNIVLIIIYIFYSIFIFGIFMAVPVFNILMGIIAGLFTGIKLRYFNLDKINKLNAINNISYFSVIVLFVLCIISAYFALASSSTQNDLKGMLNLNFEVTRNMILGLIIIGGLILLFIQYWITKFTAIIISEYKNSENM